MLVARWYDAAGSDAKLRRKLLRAVADVVDELPRRDHWQEVMTVGLDGGERLAIEFETDRSRVFPAGSFLAVSTIVPGWGYGWRRILPDEEVYKVFSWFMHFCRQYIHRSYVCRALMVAVEEERAVLHPFGSWYTAQRYGPMIPMPARETVLDYAKEAAIVRFGQGATGRDVTDSSHQVQSAWTTRNTVDPQVHQAVFHYLRGRSLWNAGFLVEAVVALDCVIQSVAELLRVRNQVPGSSTRRQVCEALGMSGDSAGVAEFAYFMRNTLGAHAGGWRWWDVSEQLEEETMKKIDSVVREVLAMGADIATEACIVDPEPEAWSDWFLEHFEMLWSTVWYEKIDRWETELEDVGGS